MNLNVLTGYNETCNDAAGATVIISVDPEMEFIEKCYLLRRINETKYVIDV